MDKVIHYLSTCLTTGKPIFNNMSWWAIWGDPSYGSVEMTHKWGYVMAMLQEKALEAGFSKVKFKTPRYHLPQRDMRAVAIK